MGWDGMGWGGMAAAHNFAKEIEHGDISFPIVSTDLLSPTVRTAAQRVPDRVLTLAHTTLGPFPLGPVPPQATSTEAHSHLRPLPLTPTPT